MSLFTQKFDEPKKLRSVRLTDTAWDALERIATEQGLTRTDLLEKWARECRGEPKLVQDRDELRQQLEGHVKDILESKLTPKKVIKVAPYGAIKRCLEELVNRICSPD